MNARDIVYIALFAAITGALGLLPPIPVPLIPVPITAQTLGVMLAGSVLGPRRGALSVLLLLAVVAAGVPVLAGGRGGLGVFAGPTVGFLISWPVAAYVIGLKVDRIWPRLNGFNAFLANVIGGIGVVYLIGVPGIALVAGTPLSAAAIGSLAFIPGDIMKAALAAAAVVAIKRGYPGLRVAGPAPSAKSGAGGRGTAHR